MKLYKAVGTALCAAIPFMTGPAIANEEYPSKPVSFVIPYPPGGTSDVVGRLIADGMSRHLDETVIVEYKPGAGTVVGANQVAKSSADGYTVLLSSPGIAINASLHEELPYDTQKLQHISTVADLPMALFVPVNSPYNSLEDIITTAQGDPEAISYGTAGVGSTGHLTVKLMEHLTNMQLLHTPFQGSAPSVNAAVGEHVEMTVDTVFLGKPMVDNKKLKPIVSFGRERSPLLPDTPIASESGMPELISTAWYAIAMPRGASDEIVQKINTAINNTLAEKKSRETLESMGLTVIGDSSEEAEERFQSALATMADAVELSGEKIR